MNVGNSEICFNLKMYKEEAFNLMIGAKTLYCLEQISEIP